MKGGNTPNPRFDASDSYKRPKWDDVFPSGGARTLLGKTTEAISAASFGEVEFYSGDLGSETASGKTVDAYNRGDAIDDDIWVNLIARGGGWEMFPLECNA